MRRTNLALLAGIAFALLVSSCAHKSSSENTSPAAAEIQRLIEQRFRANSNADRNYYERLLRPDFLYMRAAPLPISTKQQYLDGEFAGGSDLPRATGTVTDLRIFVDHDTAVASYVSTESTTIGTQKFDNVSNRMDTYVFKDGRWQILSMAASHRPAWPQPVEVPDHVLASYTGRCFTREWQPLRSVRGTKESPTFPGDSAHLLRQIRRSGRENGICQIPSGK